MTARKTARRWTRVLGTLILLFVARSVARAHDPYESWTMAALRADALEMNITIAQSTALQLIDPEHKIAGLTAENFPGTRARFEREAAALYIVTSGRTRLAPKRVDVELTEEGDIAFKIVFPRPAAGRLHFHAAFLKKLGAGYGGIIEATDEQDQALGWEQISFENPNLEVVVPVSARPPAKSGV